MNIKNLFSNKKAATQNTKVEKMDKTQLEKVIGGAETETPPKVIVISGHPIDTLNGLIR